MNRKNGIIIAICAVLLVVMTATASAFITKSQMEEKNPVEQAKVVKKQAKKEEIVWNQPRQTQPQQPQQQQTRCDDGNIVGAAIGGAAGGLIGNQFGKGKGKDLATIGGVIAGGTAGHQMIPTRNVLCR